MRDEHHSLFDDNTVRAGLHGPGSFVLSGQYEVVREVGRGAMGTVFLAKHLALGRPVAVKFPSVLLASDPAAIAALKAEARLVMNLVHDHIVQVRDFVEEGAGGYMVMDYVEGRSLQETLHEAGPLPESEVLRIFAPIAAALDYAHSRGVVHRDVKPGNILIDTAGKPRLTDFGVASVVTEQLTRITGTTPSGTLAYMSPEQLHNRPPAPSQDVYALAATMYECLRGAPPFTGSGVAPQIDADVPPPLPGRATPLSRSILSGLSKDPRERPKRCADLLASARTGVVAPERTRWSPAVPGALAILLLAGVLAVIVMMNRERPTADLGAFTPAPRAAEQAATPGEEERVEPIRGTEIPAASASEKPGPHIGKDPVHGIPPAPAGAVDYGEEVLRRYARLVEAGEHWGPPAWNSEMLLETTHRETGLTFVLLPGTGSGGFLMGSPDTEVGRDEDEVQRRVRITPFLLSKTECTNAAWSRGSRVNRSKWREDRLPVENVSWMDCISWGAGFQARLRLPSEAEWEYACRAGTKSRFSCGDRESELDRVGWYAENSSRHTHPVGSKGLANRFGLLDMHGNVWEWCADRYVSAPAGAPAGGVPLAEQLADDRVSRGGSWYCVERNCRSANRRAWPATDRLHYVGFRPAATLP